MSYRCVYEPGELPRLTKEAQEEFQGYGVMLRKVTGDSAHASEDVISMINTRLLDEENQAKLC